MTVNNANTDFYKYYAQPTNIYKKVSSHEKIFTEDLSQGEKYSKTEPLNLSKKAIQLGQPESLSTQLSKNVVKQNQTFQFKESVASKEEAAMIKHIMQQLVADALISNAAIIRSSHEQKGDRKESAK